MSSATAIIDSLDANEIRRRIAEMDSERRALVVLLRAAVKKPLREHRHPSVELNRQAPAAEKR